jgi:hypothetical protein
MEQIGRDALKALDYVEKYLPLASELAMEIFPAQTAAITGVVNSVALVQKAVVVAEQKMAAANLQNGTGLQKSADVLSIVTPTVTQLLTAEGVKVDAAYIQTMIDTIVGILKLRDATPPASVSA